MIAVLVFIVGIPPAMVSGQTLNLDYSTYLGTGHGRGISVGADGRAYIVGYTDSTDFPAENPYQSTHGGGSWDVFVTALTASGSALSYSTYLGGSGMDFGHGISLGSDGSAYVAGETTSSAFPLENPYQATHNGGDRDGFVSKLTLTEPPPTSNRPWITDYNGDGTLDIAIFRTGSGLWAIRGISRICFGDKVATGYLLKPGSLI